MFWSVHLLMNFNLWIHALLQYSHILNVCSIFEYVYHVEKENCGCGIFSCIYFSRQTWLKLKNLFVFKCLNCFSAFQILYFYINPKKKVAWDCCDFQYIQLYLFLKVPTYWFLYFFTYTLKFLYRGLTTFLSPEYDSSAPNH